MTIARSDMKLGPQLTECADMIHRGSQDLSYFHQSRLRLWMNDYTVEDKGTCTNVWNAQECPSHQEYTGLPARASRFRRFYSELKLERDDAIIRAVA